MMQEIVDKLQNMLSIICLLENDMEAQKAEEIHIRAVKLIHKLNSEAIEDLKKC